MHLERHVALVAMMMGVGATACGGSVNVSSASSGGGDSGGAGGGGGATSTSSTGGGTTASTGGGTTSGSGGGLPMTFCQEACVKMADGGCFQTADCTAYCDSHAPEWTPEIGAAFATCAAENPLCFESVEGCILGELHPTGTNMTVRLDGSGLDAYDGKLLSVWHDPGAGPTFGGEVVLSGGQFKFEWSEAVYGSDTGGPLLLLYIDMDGDGTCKPAADITASLNTAWNGDYLDPVFSATVVPPLNDPDFVCDFLP